MSDAFYFSKQDLATLINYYENRIPSVVGDKVLKGFVFRKVVNALGDENLCADPLYSAFPTGDPNADDDQQIPNNNAPGCPYPPGY